MDEGTKTPPVIRTPDLDDHLEAQPDALDDDARVDGALIAEETVAGLEDVRVRNSRLQDVQFTGASVTASEFVDVEFVGCDLSGCVVETTTFERVAFVGCRMTGFTAPGVRALHVTFTECQLVEAWFRMARLDRFAFDGCDLSEADFYQANLSAGRLVGCDLSRAEFSDVTVDDVAVHGSTFDGIRGADSLRNLTIAANQVMDLARPVLGARGIVIDDDYLDR